jgi:hypothetical protein
MHQHSEMESDCNASSAKVAAIGIKQKGAPLIEAALPLNDSFNFRTDN